MKWLSAKIWILFIVLMAGVFFWPARHTEAADCQINDLQWQNDTAVVGEKVGMRVVGNADCKDKQFSLIIYEDDTGMTDDEISVVTGTFPSTGITAVTSYSFSEADYKNGGDERDYETIYFTIVLDKKEVSGKQSGFLKLAKPTSGETCRLSSAKWNTVTKYSPIIGSPVQMIVKGVGCSKRGIGLVIKEYDVGRNDKLAETSAIFDAEGTQAVATWTIGDEGAGDQYGSYEFFFTAGLAYGEETIESNKLVVPVNSINGCVNCNNGGIPPDVCQCYDGASGARTMGGSCDIVCKEHLSDAKIGADLNSSGINAKDGDIKLGPLDFGFKINPPNSWTNLSDMLAAVAQFVFQLGTMLAVVFIVWNGFLYMTSGGDVGKTKKARMGIFYSALGLFVLIVGKGFVSLIMSLIDALGKGGGG